MVCSSMRTRYVEDVYSIRDIKKILYQVYTYVRNKGTVFE